MNKSLIRCALIASLVSAAYSVRADEPEVFKKKGYTLTFESLDSGFDPKLKKRMVKTFFKVYPVLVKEFNPQAAKEVKFVIDTSYKGVAATSRKRVVYSAKYMGAKPEDIDVVTHEVMHVVQEYGYRSGPVWLTEGIADYVRYKFGVDNKGAGWTMPEYKEGQSYTNSYRITARFFAWLEKNVKPGLIKEIDSRLRARTYKAEAWAELTGKDIDQLWKSYSENPVL